MKWLEKQVTMLFLSLMTESVRLGCAAISRRETVRSFVKMGYISCWSRPTTSGWVQDGRYICEAERYKKNLQRIFEAAKYAARMMLENILLFCLRWRRCLESFRRLKYLLVDIEIEGDSMGSEYTFVQ